MFRLNKSSSGVSKNHKTNYNMPVHIWDPTLKSYSGGTDPHILKLGTTLSFTTFPIWPNKITFRHPTNTSFSEPQRERKKKLNHPGDRSPNPLASSPQRSHYTDRATALIILIKGAGTKVKHENRRAYLQSVSWLLG